MTQDNRGQDVRATTASGAVLLEVVLAMALFFTSAMVIAGGLSASMSALRKIKLDAQASDLAVTKLSEVQMGVLAAVDEGPNPYEEEDLAQWTWQILAVPADPPGTVQPTSLKKVEVIIRNTTDRYTYRLAEFLQAREDEGELFDMAGGGP